MGQVQQRAEQIAQEKRLNPNEEQLFMVQVGFYIDSLVQTNRTRENTMDGKPFAEYWKQVVNSISRKKVKQALKKFISEHPLGTPTASLPNLAEKIAGIRRARAEREQPKKAKKQKPLRKRKKGLYVTPLFDDDGELIDEEEQGEVHARLDSTGSITFEDENPLNKNLF